MKNLVTGTITTIAAAGILAGCEVKTMETASVGVAGLAAAFEGDGYKILDTGPAKRSKLDFNRYKMTETVCDPLDGEGNPQLKNGIKAELFWLNSGMPRSEKVEDLITQAVRSEKKLFFTDLHTPTRLFTEGFATQTSETMKDDSGNVLIEWFGLRFNSGLRLPAGLEEGQWELALLSDDGTILRVSENNGMSVLINNDGIHPTRMGCSSQFVNLSKTGVLNFDLLYAQGPRYHISNVLMWRHISKTEGMAGKDQACGETGNEHFFDPENNSKPQSAYKGLLARGWNPVPAEAFVIPNDDYNPCHAGTPPVISGFQVAGLTQTEATLSWATDIPATTQARWTNMKTGEVTESLTDNMLRTAHGLMLNGLTQATTYSVEIIAVSADNGRSVAGPYMFTTLGGAF